MSESGTPATPDRASATTLEHGGAPEQARLPEMVVGDQIIGSAPDEPTPEPAAGTPVARSAAGGPEPAAGDPDPEPAAGDPDPEPAAGGEPVARRAPVTGTYVIAVLGAANLAAMVWSAHASVAAFAGVPSLALTAAAATLPTLISASLLAGAALGTAAVAAGVRRRPGLESRAAYRHLAGVTGGVAAGLLAAGGALAAYGHGAPITVLAEGVAVGAVLGGVLAGIRARRVLSAGLAAALSSFAITYLLNVFHGRLLALLGAGSTLGSINSAAGRLAWTTSALAGVAAGVVAYLYLRRDHPGGARGPGYLVAGAVPGLLIILSIVVTAAGGAQVFGVTSALSYAMIILFAGAIVSIVLYGRSLTPAAGQPPAVE